MTTIYQGCCFDSNSFWVVSDVCEVRYFAIAPEMIADSIFDASDIEGGADGGAFKLITHRDALDLLAHWPEGHAELAKILADDPESEFAVNKI
jgi:hypothetical protein